jgi:hypothetical protein
VDCDTGERPLVAHVEASALATHGEHLKGSIGESSAVEGVVVYLIDGNYVHVCVLLLKMGGQMSAQRTKASRSHFATKRNYDAKPRLVTRLRCFTTCGACSMLLRTLTTAEVVVLIPAARSCGVDILETGAGSRRDRRMHPTVVAPLL